MLDNGTITDGRSMGSHGILPDSLRVNELLLTPQLSATAHGTAAKLLARLHKMLEHDASLVLGFRSRCQLLEACFATVDRSISRFHDEAAEDMQTTHRIMLLLMFANREQETDQYTWRRVLSLMERGWIHLENTSVISQTTDMEEKESGGAGNGGDGWLEQMEATMGEDEADDGIAACIAGVDASSLQQKCTFLGLGTLCRECNEAILSSVTTLFLIFARDAVAEKQLYHAMQRTIQDSATFNSDEVYLRTKSVSKQACSELGQNALKDLILSFRLPRGIVGIRRTLLLQRETSSMATRDHTELVQTAHEAAMLTSETVWQDTEFDVVARTCALLSGIAMLYAHDAEDVRDNDAYNGIVELPFLHSTGRRKEMRVKLVDNTWVCYDTTRGHMCVHFQGEGLDGLVGCVMHLTTHVRPD